MKQSAYYRRIRATFLDSPDRPSRTAYEGTGCDLDSRRWGGRSAESCGKQWTKIKSSCVKFHGWVERLKGMNLTGNPTGDEIKSCATNVYNNRSAMASQIYDIFNNSEYRIGSPFSFIECYEWFSKNSSVLDCGPSAITEDDAPVCQDIEEAFTDVVVADDVAGEVEIESGIRTRGKRLRPLGTKAA
jgi:hypothetical protein